jgi:hypothetical protein
MYHLPQVYIVTYHLHGMISCLIFVTIASTIILFYLPRQLLLQVGLLNYPNDAIPDILNGVTSGTYINGVGGAPWNYIPR